MLDATIDPGIYTDFEGLDKLHAQAVKNPQAAKKAVAQQFESILVQMMMHSMREANKSFASDLFENNEMDMYQDIYDKQISLVISQHGTGLAEAIEQNIDATTPPPPPQPLATVPAKFSPPAATPLVEPILEPQPAKPVAAQTTPPIATFDSQQSFIKELWPAAKIAASVLGITPELLLAQAALETDWGKKILFADKNTSSHNLFNIKASALWKDKTLPIDTLEEKNGLLVKDKANFKIYDSYKACFLDYVKLLKENDRYSGTLKASVDPQQFVQALQKAGFATDSHYGDKIMQIYGSHSFKDMIAQVQ
jgi:peptidoglycan hydrolase FlgJ